MTDGQPLEAWNPAHKAASHFSRIEIPAWFLVVACRCASSPCYRESRPCLLLSHPWGTVCPFLPPEPHDGCAKASGFLYIKED